MNQELAMTIGPLVNNPKMFAILKEYTDFRVAYLRKQLEEAVSIDDVRKHQGAIKELHRFKTLNTEAQGVMNEIRN